MEYFIVHSRERRGMRDHHSLSLYMDFLIIYLLGRSSSFCFLGSFCSLLTFVPRVEAVHFLLEEMDFYLYFFVGCYFFRDVPKALASLRRPMSKALQKGWFPQTFSLRSQPALDESLGVACWGLRFGSGHRGPSAGSGSRSFTVGRFRLEGFYLVPLPVHWRILHWNLGAVWTVSFEIWWRAMANFWPKFLGS